jgi:hypothetical protein
MFGDGRSPGAVDSLPWPLPAYRLMEVIEERHEFPEKVSGTVFGSRRRNGS